MPAGPAAEVEDREPGDVAEGLPHQRLLEADERVGFVVVDLRPAVVPALDGAFLGRLEIGHVATARAGGS